jgi:hypothetical protein
VKLANFHILRLIRDNKKEIPRLHPSLFRHCFQAVSRLNPKNPEPTCVANKDPDLAASVAAYRGTRGGDTFPHREGIGRALEHAVNHEMANLQNHVKVHLVSRIKRWLTIRLEGELRQKGIVDKHVKKLVERMVSRVEYDEEKNAAIAMAEGKKPPPIPCWEPPGSARDMLGEDWLGRFTGPALTAASLDVIWQVWETLINHMGQGKLPLCQTHFEKDGWKEYFPLLCKMLADVEAADDCQPAVPVAPVDQPSKAWSIREVKKILGWLVPGTAKKKAASELVHSVIRQKPFRRDLKAFRTFSSEQLAKLKAKSKETIAEIKSKSFRPKKYFQRRGPHRQFHIFPQHGFATRYFPMDTRVFYDLHRILWKDGKHPHPRAGELTFMKDRDADFSARKGFWWNSVFDFTKLKGVDVPGVEIPGRTEKQRHFSFYMSTDGVGCSFVFWKPKDRADKKKKKKLTPMDAPVTEETVVRVVDPGVTDIVRGITSNPSWIDDGRTGKKKKIQQFGDDRESVFRVSSAEWHDKAYHNGARRRCFQLRGQALARGTDIHGLQRSIPSGKTMDADVFLKHAIQAVRVYPTLYEHSKKERVIRWKTYQKEQKALHELCIRVIGDPSLKNVIVVCGDGHFGSTMIGKQSVPLKRFREYLEGLVPVVLTSEMRTSRVCSNGCFWEQPGDAPEEDELIPMRGERSASGRAGPSIHAVRRCQECGTIWNRDVNAARNIARMFWYLREHAGEMPPWSRRRPQQQQ